MQVLKSQWQIFYL